MRFAWAAVVTAAAATAFVCATAMAAVTGPGAAQADYGVRLAAPVDLRGAPTHARVTAGVAFLLRLDLFADASRGDASVVYDVDLPTGVRVAVRRLRLPTGALTSRCLRGCSVGWNTGRSRRLSVYYAFVLPGPGDFIIEARLTSTNHSDEQPADDRGSITIVSVAARLTLGLPVLAAGPPLPGRTFGVTVPVRRSGGPVRPGRATCAAAIDGKAVAGAVAVGRGSVRCAWRIPPGSAGKTLRTTVAAAAGALHVSGEWVYAIQKS